MPIHEADRRRVDVFRAEAPVVLADGQTWWLPKPRARFAPDAGESGFKRVLTLRGDDGYHALYLRAEAAQRALDAAEAAEAAEPGSAPEYSGPTPLGCLLAMAVYLLKFNYDLSDAEVAELVQFPQDEDDEEGVRVQADVTAVAFGRAPKPSGGTSD